MLTVLQPLFGMICMIQIPMCAFTWYRYIIADTRASLNAIDGRHMHLKTLTDIAFWEGAAVGAGTIMLTSVCIIITFAAMNL